MRTLDTTSYSQHLLPGEHDSIRDAAGRTANPGLPETSKYPLGGQTGTGVGGGRSGSNRSRTPGSHSLQLSMVKPATTSMIFSTSAGGVRRSGFAIVAIPS